MMHEKILENNFREIFSKIIKASAPGDQEKYFLKADWIETPLGTMIVIADDKALYLLEFSNRRGLESQIKKVRKKTESTIVYGRTDPIGSIEKELSLYFKGTFQDFHTSIKIMGSPFQEKVWLELKKIPPGKTSSYLDIATAMKNPGAFRAIGGANGANQFAIIIPCHRIICSNGELGGYAGGLARKKWLLVHEKKYAIKS